MFLVVYRFYKRGRVSGLRLRVSWIVPKFFPSPLCFLRLSVLLGDAFRGLGLYDFRMSGVLDLPGVMMIIMIMMRINLSMMP